MVASIPIQSHLVMPNFSSDIPTPSRINCSSWRLAVETNNLRNWTLVPEASDAAEAEDVISTGASEGKMSDSSASSSSSSDFEATEYESINRVVSQMNAIFNPEAISACVNVIFDEEENQIQAASSSSAPKLTRRVIHRDHLGAAKLLYDHYFAPNYTYPPDMFRRRDVAEEDGMVFKSRKRKELEEDYGYKIRENIGDQWSDLLGTKTGQRTFKLPNPLYNITSRNILD
uniref:acid phosphatase 1-like n=1 Tax=Erigeron canadensis TaxID=72917 RepID=UPI001CB8ED07|nr:acid phosphatase 1-like [Erigeron canadensis]